MLRACKLLEPIQLLIAAMLATGQGFALRGAVGVTQVLLTWAAFEFGVDTDGYAFVRLSSDWIKSNLCNVTGTQSNVRTLQDSNFWSYTATLPTTVTFFILCRYAQPSNLLHRSK